MGGICTKSGCNDGKRTENSDNNDFEFFFSRDTCPVPMNESLSCSPDILSKHNEGSVMEISEVKKEINLVQNSHQKFPSNIHLIIKENRNHCREGEIVNLQNLGFPAKKDILVFGSDANCDYQLMQDELIQPQHFQVEFDNSKSLYLISSIFKSKVSIKVETSQTLSDGDMLSFGTNLLQLSITKGDFNNTTRSSLLVKCLSGVNKSFQ